MQEEQIDTNHVKKSFKRIMYRIKTSETMVPENKVYTLKYLEDSAISIFKRMNVHKLVVKNTC